MGKNKMISKSCPKCEQQLPVACKACPCGHNFFNAKKVDISPASEISKRRRTERVKREKPNYYDALEYDKQTKKRNRSRSTSQVQGNQQRKVDIGEGNPQLKKKRRKKCERDTDEKEPTVSNISPENGVKCLVILAELNRKIGTTSWRD